MNLFWGAVLTGPVIQGLSEKWNLLEEVTIKKNRWGNIHLTCGQFFRPIRILCFLILFGSDNTRTDGRDLDVRDGGINMHWNRKLVRAA